MRFEVAHRPRGSNLLDDYVLVSVDADLSCDAERALRDLPRAQLGMLGQCARRGERVRAAGADGEDAAFVGRDDVAVAGEEERALLVGDDEQRLQVAQNLVRAPLLAQFDGGTLKVAVVLFEFAFKAREEREGVGGGPGEAAENLLVVESADFARAALHDRVAVCHLSVPRERDAPPAPYEQDGCAAKLSFGATHRKHCTIETGEKGSQASLRGGRTRVENRGARARIRTGVEIWVMIGV